MKKYGRILHVSPGEYWLAAQRNLSMLPWPVQYASYDASSLEAVAGQLAKFEEATWNIPTPSFVRTNFGLYGPGVILAVDYQDAIVASLYFIGPFGIDRSAHIWTLVVHPDFRKQGYGQQMLATAAACVHGLCDKFTLQARSDSNAIPLYLKLGSGRIMWAQKCDTGTWNKPKIGLSFSVPNDPLDILQAKTGLADVTGCTAVAADGDFWRKLGQDTECWGKHLLIDWRIVNGQKTLYVKV